MAIEKLTDVTLLPDRKTNQIKFTFTNGKTYAMQFVEGESIVQTIGTLRGLAFWLENVAYDLSQEAV